MCSTTVAAPPARGNADAPRGLASGGVLDRRLPVRGGVLDDGGGGGDGLGGAMSAAALLDVLLLLGIWLLLSVACHVKPEDRGRVSEGWKRRQGR